MSANYYLPNGLARNITPAPEGLIEVDSIIDVGAGIRPVSWLDVERHICVEPYGPYADKLEACAFEVARGTAVDVLPTLAADSVFLLDVLEHMEKDEGIRTLDLAKHAASRQVVVFVPYGWMEQSEDAWGMGGEFWQTHRSEWYPEEFDGWSTYRYRRNFFAVLNV